MNRAGRNQTKNQTCAGSGLMPGTGFGSQAQVRRTGPHFCRGTVVERHLLFAVALLLLSACSGTTANRTVSTPELTATHFSVAAQSASMSGTAFNFTVTAVDASDNVVTSYSGVVHFISSDGQAVLPDDSALTNGMGSFKATMTNLGPQHITATDTSTAITGTSSSINVLPARSLGEYGPEVLWRRT